MALLRAIGAGRRQVLGSVMLEALVVGLVASAVGIVAGIALAFGLKAALAGLGLDLPDAGAVVKSNTIVTSMIVGTLITVLAAFFPARKASRRRPSPPCATWPRTSGSSKGRRSPAWPRRGIGLLPRPGRRDATIPGTASGHLLVGGHPRPHRRADQPLLAWPIPRLKGITGVLARENAIRNPKRTASTAAALMIAVTLIGFITIFADSAKASVDKSIDDNFNGDFVIDSQTFGQGGLPVAMADRRTPSQGERGRRAPSETQIAFRPTHRRRGPCGHLRRGGRGYQRRPDALTAGAVALSIDQAEELTWPR
jgi:putative ABC transport system permease protein